MNQIKGCVAKYLNYEYKYPALFSLRYCRRSRDRSYFC